MWIKKSDDSIEDATGKVIVFSNERFVNDICLGDCCFICGAKPGTKEFNNEHILPAWLLRDFDLFARTITIPNGNKIRYGSYTVPCCKDCNSLMGEVVETPISEVVRNGPEAINNFILQGGLLKIFVWMGLIYLKTHLKDRSMRVHLDKRRGEQKIADDYEWERLHHIHSVVRCFYTGCTVEPEALGSFLSLPVSNQEAGEPFDFVDLYLAQTMLLRLNETAILCVFNDSGEALSKFKTRLEKISGPLSRIQLREVLTEFALLNFHLKTRPTFHTESNLEKETCKIVGIRPQLEMRPIDLKLRGKLLRHALDDIPPEMQFQDCTREEAITAIDAGTMTFLFDDNGNFIEKSIQSE